MKNNYKCEYPDCENTSKIRTKIKDRNSEFYGLRVCPKHARELVPKKVSDKTRRTQEARKEQRKDYPEFYQKHIEIARKKCCEECGTKLWGNSTEVVHVLAKSTSPEVATNDDNIIYLCSNHHDNFDSSLSKREKMKCFNLALDKYKKIKSNLIKITSETIHYDSFLI